MASASHEREGHWGIFARKYRRVQSKRSQLQFCDFLFFAKNNLKCHVLQHSKNKNSNITLFLVLLWRKRRQLRPVCKIARCKCEQLQLAASTRDAWEACGHSYHVISHIAFYSLGLDVDDSIYFYKLLLFLMFMDTYPCYFFIDSYNYWLIIKILF